MPSAVRDCLGQETNVLKVFFLIIYNVFHFRPFNFSALKFTSFKFNTSTNSIALEYSKSLFLTFSLKNNVFPYLLLLLCCCGSGSCYSPGLHLFSLK